MSSVLDALWDDEEQPRDDSVVREFAMRWIATHEGVDGKKRLTVSEREEVVRLASGYQTKGSANEIERSVETIRQRRKRIYRKLDVEGHLDLIATMLADALAAHAPE